MRRFFFIAIGLFVFMLSACRSQRQAVRQETHDSTTVSFRNVEKTVHIDGDSVSVSMQLIPDSKAPKTDAPQIAQLQSEPSQFVPQQQVIETGRTKIKVEVTKTGQIKATAVSKEIDKKVTVQEKTVSTYKSEQTEYQAKESWFSKLKSALGKWVIGILFIAALLVALYAIFKKDLNPVSIIKNIIKNL